MPVTHSTVVGVADDGVSPVGTDEWNAPHKGMSDGSYNVMDYGAKGDGSTDDASSIAAAITACPAGGTVFFPSPTTYYKINSGLTVAKALTLMGNGLPLIQTAATIVMLTITSSDVQVRGLWFKGSTGTYTGGQCGIATTGGVIGSPYLRVRVRDCRFETLSDTAVLLRFCNDFELSGNIIYDIGYAGLQTESCIRGRVWGNAIQKINCDVGGSGNGYGITLTRNNSLGELNVAPHTQDVTVVGNTVRDNAVWDGISSHGGQNLVISSNTIRECLHPIQMVGCKNQGGTLTYAPKDFSITGNTIENASTGSLYGVCDPGIVVNGVSTDFATGTVTGNVIKGCGHNDSGSSGGLQVVYSAGVVVAGNYVVEPGHAGIMLNYGNTDLVVSGNVIVDPWSSTLNTFCIEWGDGTATTTSGYVGGNNFARGSKAATHVCEYGLFVYNAGTNDITFGLNRNEAATYLYDASKVTKTPVFTSNLGFYGTAPIAQQTGVPVTAAGIHAACVALGLFTA